MKKKYISLLFFTIVFGFYGIQVIFFNPFKCFDREMVHNIYYILGKKSQTFDLNFDSVFDILYEWAN